MNQHLLTDLFPMHKKARVIIDADVVQVDAHDPVITRLKTQQLMQTICWQRARRIVARQRRFQESQILELMKTLRYGLACFAIASGKHRPETSNVPLSEREMLRPGIS
jgi:hypothetical protein